MYIYIYICIYRYIIQRTSSRSLQSVIIHYTFVVAMLFYVVYLIMLYYMISCHIILLCHVILNYSVLCYIILYYIKLHCSICHPARNIPYLPPKTPRGMRNCKAHYHFYLYCYYYYYDYSYY